jgi:hypothetical protein
MFELLGLLEGVSQPQIIQWDRAGTVNTRSHIPSCGPLGESIRAEKLAGTPFSIARYVLSDLQIGVFKLVLRVVALCYPAIVQI